VRLHNLGNLRDGRLYAAPLLCRDSEGSAVDRPGEFGRRTPLAALCDEAVGGVVDNRRIFPGGQHGIDHRGCKGVLLLRDAFDVDPALIVERQDEVHTPDHLDWNAVAEFDDDFGHARALTCQIRHRLVRRVSNQPLEHAALQPDNPVLFVDEVATAGKIHGVTMAQFEASGRSLRSQRVPCQFEMRPSALHRGHDQTIASSWARAIRTSTFLHLKQFAATTPVSS